jgi:phosphatidylethanolamine N-methyltransferase
MNSVINFSDPILQKAAIIIILAPVIWNILARIEYHTHLLTKLALGNKYLGCYLLAAYIFLFSVYRDLMFSKALDSQPKAPFLDKISVVGYALVIVGSVFVLSSMWALGITGTYLGDYFGILMDAPVTGFPFNVLKDPMYDGASMIFLGKALLERSVAGILLSALVFVVYKVALLFEGPFTTFIYSEAAKNKKK